MEERDNQMQALVNKMLFHPDTKESAKACIEILDIGIRPALKTLEASVQHLVDDVEDQKQMHQEMKDAVDEQRRIQVRIKSD